MFHDAANGTRAITHDTAIAGRVSQLDGEQRQAVLRCQCGQLAQGIQLGQRHVAVQNQRHARTRQMRQCLHHRMAGAVLLGLQRPGDVGVGDGVRHRVAAIAVYHADLQRIKLARAVEYMRQQRLAGQRM